jgi:hypothetical protein
MMKSFRIKLNKKLETNLRNYYQQETKIEEL